MERARWYPVLALAVAVVVLVATGVAGAAALRTPGYAGITRPVALRPAVTPPAPVVGPGTRPDLLVDAAGTTHLVWTEAVSGQPTRTMYCRIPRGSRSCETASALVPPGADRFSVDLAGPAVAAVNDQVVVMSARYPQPVGLPDGTTGDNAVWLWTSDDGGAGFSEPAVVASGDGPGTAVAGDVRGGAVAFGAAEAPQIAVATGVVTGGVTVTTIRPGQYTALGASVAVGDFVDARLAVHEGVPVVVYRDLAGNGYLRRWSGQGDPNDAGSWTPQQPLPGFNPEVAVAGGRLVVALTDRLSGGTLRVVDLSRGGAPAVINPRGSTGEHSVAGLPDGRVVVTWRGTDAAGTAATWMRVVSAAGRPLAAPVAVGPPGTFSRMAAGPDAGGVVAAQAPGGGISVAAFGPRTPTGLAGLGGRPGGGALPPDTAVGCQRIRFGAVESLLQDGCFLTAATGRAKASTGTVRLNGLDIVPDPGVQVLIDARARTIDTTGTVRVLLRAPGVPEITLFRGRLNLRLAGARPGVPLFSIPAGLFRPSVLGFPVAGDIDVLITDRGVRIPVSLRLPAAFGGVAGDTVLRADSARGLVIDSLEFRADGVPLGVATMRRLRVQYKAAGGTSVGDCLRPRGSGAPAQPDEWAGVFELQLPPPAGGPAICGSVRFGQGAFRAATFNIDLPFPGIVLFPGASITALGGGLSLRPTRIDAGVRIGVIPASAAAALVTLDGRLSATFGTPFTLRGDVAAAVLGVPIGDGTFVMSTDGYVGLRLNAGPSVGPLAVRTRIAGFVDGPRRQFSLSGRGDICIDDVCVDGGGAVVSTRGIAACLPAPAVPRGAGYRWGRPVIGGVSIWLLSCDMGEFEVGDQRMPALREQQVGGQVVPVAIAPGAPTVDLRIQGVGAVPAVEVLDPAGAVVTPAATFADREAGTLYVGLRAPRAGTWSVRTLDGSAPVAQVAQARQVAPATLTGARVTGAGRGPRTLAYRARIGRDQAITLVERGAGGSRVLAPARPGARTLRFTPGPGPGGRREIVALVAQSGLVRSERVVARFTAPPPAAVGRARALRISRAGTRAVITWAPGAGAAVQRVVISRADGRRVARVLPGGARRTVLTRVRRGERVVVTVLAQARDGRSGRVARAAVRLR